MCSRGVYQLQKLTVYFCDYGGSSTGVRDVLASNKLKDFISANPQIQFQFICKRNHHPHIKTAYINGYTKSIPLRNFDQQQVHEAFEGLRNQLGRKAFQVSGPRVFNSRKSIQGQWQSNLFNKYPIAELSAEFQFPSFQQHSQQREVSEKKVRERDEANSTMRIRPFVDYNRESL